MTWPPVDRGENVRRQICLTLEEMGVQPERSHHEQGPGQNEIDFRCASPLQAADDLMTVHTVVKAIAGQNGLYASFLPKPLPEKSGSGLHLNFSLLHGGRNVFEDFQTAPDPMAAAFLAGILRRVPELTVFTNPLPGSYQRLGCCEAPGVVSWSCQNRSSLVRVPAARGADCRMELRSPDAACNPYYAVALLLEAGLEGVRENLPLPPRRQRRPAGRGQNRRLRAAQNAHRGRAPGRTERISAPHAARAAAGRLPGPQAARRRRLGPPRPTRTGTRCRPTLTACERCNPKGR